MQPLVAVAAVEVLLLDQEDQEVLVVEVEVEIQNLTPHHRCMGLLIVEVAVVDLELLPDRDMVRVSQLVLVLLLFDIQFLDK